MDYRSHWHLEAPRPYDSTLAPSSLDRWGPSESLESGYPWGAQGIRLRRVTFSAPPSSHAGANCQTALLALHWQITHAASCCKSICGNGGIAVAVVEG